MNNAPPKPAYYAFDNAVRAAMKADRSLDRRKTIRKVATDEPDLYRKMMAEANPDADIAHLVNAKPAGRPAVQKFHAAVTAKLAMNEKLARVDAVKQVIAEKPQLAAAAEAEANS